MEKETCAPKRRGCGLCRPPITHFRFKLTENIASSVWENIRTCQKSSTFSGKLQQVRQGIAAHLDYGHL